MVLVSEPQILSRWAHQNEYYERTKNECNLPLEYGKTIKNGVICLVSMFLSWVMGAGVNFLGHFYIFILVKIGNYWYQTKLLSSFCYVYQFFKFSKAICAKVNFPPGSFTHFSQKKQNKISSLLVCTITAVINF